MKNFLPNDSALRFLIGIVLLVPLLILSSCAPVQVSAGSTDTIKTFTFGTSKPPLTLDSALTNDTEALRVSRQIMEPLISLDRINGEPVPGLALSWSQSEDRLKTTFTLRSNITFHDGTLFDGNAVCANFERWHNLPKQLRNQDPSNQFKALFQPLPDKGATSIYRGCAAPNPATVTISLSQPYQPLIKALSQPAFAIASPRALSDRKADAPTTVTGSISRSRFGEHPVGTGPYIISSWSGQEITLKRNDDYWGKKGNVGIVRFKTIDTIHARVEALISGEVDAIDNLSAHQYNDLRRRSNQGTRVLPRDPYSVAFLNINQKYAPLTDPLLRAAISQALERNTIVSENYITGSTAAYHFLPPRLTAFGETAGMPTHNIDEAKKLLAKSRYSGEPIPFYYPVDFSETYLPEPGKIFAVISRQLTALGLNIKPVPIDWQQNYPAGIQDKKHGLSLSGINGMYRDPESFLGTLLSSAVTTSGYSNPKTAELLSKARRSADDAERTEAYKKIQTTLDKDLPVIPLVFPISALATGSRVVSYPISPIMDETFNDVMLK